MIQVIATLKPKIQISVNLKPKILVTATLLGITIETDQDVEFIAQENIAAFDVVTIDGFKARSANASHRSKVLGISRTAVNTGFTGIAINEGEISNPAWAWTISQNLFLNGVGQLSATPPSSAFSQIIGRATGANKMLVELEESYLL